MKTNFGLTPCNAKLRRRTLCGKKIYYHTYYEPKGLGKKNRVEAIHRFKHPKNKEELYESTNMIGNSIWEFLKQHDIDEFDVIIGIPSSSNVVKKVIDSLIINCDFKGDVVYRGFKKTRIRNVKLKQHIIDRESSLKTKSLVPKSFQFIRQHYYDKVAKIALFPTRFRRYFENFLELNISNPHCLIGKKVLIVDDTIGEGATMHEAVRLLKPYTNDVIGFTVMKDM